MQYTVKKEMKFDQEMHCTPSPLHQNKYCTSCFISKVIPMSKKVVRFILCFN